MTDTPPDAAAPARAATPYRRTRLDYRLGVHGQFRDWMLSRLRTSELQSPTAGMAATLNLDDPNGFVHALVSSWAAIGDNLSFYQERIAQEGFLRTATEAFSVRALTAALGYAPRSATSATTHLALTLTPRRDGDDSAPLAVAKGLAVQSIATGAAPAVVFETDGDFVGRVQWNALSSASSVEAAATKPITTAVKVADGRKLKPGTALVVADPSGRVATAQVRLVTEVDVQDDGAAWLGWSDALAPAGATPRLWTCTRTVRLLGADAPPWSQAPDAVKALTGTRTGAVRLSYDDGATWADAAAGLPPGDVRAAAQGSDGVLYVGVEDAVLRRTHDGWIRCGAPSLQSPVTVLRAGPHDRLYAGVARGEVLFSGDGGRTWSPAALAPTAAPEADVRPRLPSLPVEDLLFVEGRHAGLTVATAAGVWRLRPDASGWASWRDGLGGASADGTPVGVRALWRKGDAVVAATEAGLFHAAAPGSRWTLAVAGEATALAETGAGDLVAATRDGLKLSTDGRTWTALASREGRPPPDQVAASGAAIFAADGAGWSRRDGRGAGWTAGAEGRAVTLLLQVAPRLVIVAESFTGYVETDWPGLVQRPGADGWIDLNASCTGLDVDDRVVVETADELTAVRVREVELVSRNAFGRSGRVTRVRLEGAPAALDARTARLHLGGAPATIVDTVPPPLQRLDGAALRLAGAHPDLAGRTLAVTGRRPRLRLRGGAGGLRGRDDAGGWSDPQLADRTVRLLCATPAWGLVAATENDVLLAGGEAFATEALGGAATDLAAFGDLLLAAGAWGVRSATRGGAWNAFGPAGVAVRAVAVDRDVVAAASVAGLHLRDPSTGWALAEGSAGLDVTAVASWRGGWLAGTADGAVVRISDGDAVTVRTADGTRINQLLTAGEIAHAATDAGLLSWNGRERWEAVARAGTPAPSEEAAFDGEGRLWTRLRDGAVLCDGARVSTFAGDVLALTVGAEGAVYVGAARSTTLRPCAGVKAEAFAEPGELGRVAGLAAALPTRAGGSVNDAVKAALAPLGLDLGDARDLLLEAPRRWTVEVKGGRAWLTADEGGDIRVTFSRDLELMAERTSAGASARLTVRSAAGLEFEAGEVEAELLPSDPRSEAVCDVATVLSAEPAVDGLSTRLTLASPLSRTYDAASVTVNANVVRASHGETPVFGQILGDGDNTIENQAFLLEGGPHSAPSDEGSRIHHGERASHRLEVRVRDASAGDPLSISAQLRPTDFASVGQLWTEVADFARSGPLDAHYRVAETADSALSLVFGDGRRGRRLPTGAGNVLALSRIGAGADGDVGAGELVLLKKRPAGVRGAVNPLPAKGGSDAEDPLQSRWTAPARARALGRLVSLRDFEGIALARPDVGKVLAADRTAAGGSPGVVLTVMGARDVNATLDAEAGPVDLKALRADLNVLGPRRPPLTLAGAREVRFDVELAVDCAPSVIDAAGVRAAVVDALRDAFCFAARDIGEPVRAATLLAAAQAVPGVATAVLVRLNRRGAPPGTGDGLEAAPATPAGGWRGAELLVLGEAVVKAGAP